MLRVTQVCCGRALPLCQGVVLGTWERSSRPRPLLLLQTYTAVYYVLADLLMLSLYFHYKSKRRPSACEYGGPSVSGLKGQPRGPGAWEEAGFPLLGDKPNLGKTFWALSEGLSPDGPR